MKKVLSAVLSLVILFGLSLSAFAQDEHSHEFVCTAVTEDNHTYACECGEQYTEAHEFSGWQYNDDNGLFTSGTHSAVCAACGFEKTERVWGSSKFFHPFFELYYVLREFVFSVTDKLLAYFA